MGRVTVTTTLTSTLINNFAVGYNRFVNGNGAPPYELNANYASKIGIQNTSASVFPDFTFSGLNWQGGTIQQIGVGGYNSTSNGSEVIRDGATKIWAATPSTSAISTRATSSSPTTTRIRAVSTSARSRRLSPGSRTKLGMRLPASCWAR